MLEALQRAGGTAADLLSWQQVINDARGINDTQKRLARINEYFNRRIVFSDDSSVWGESDHWATPMEVLAKRQGDCEDFAIAKYFTLMASGIPREQLRLVYVKASLGGPNSGIAQAHMVLAYYPTPDAIPLVLDNLITDIRPATRRPDLSPVFSFNAEGIWVGAVNNGQSSAGGIGRLSRWQDLLRRAQLEGFD